MKIKVGTKLTSVGVIEGTWLDSGVEHNARKGLEWTVVEIIKEGSLYKIKCGMILQAVLTEPMFRDAFDLNIPRVTKFMAVPDFGEYQRHPKRLETESLSEAKTFLKRCCAMGAINGYFEESKEWKRVFNFDQNNGFVRAKKITCVGEYLPYVKFYTKPALQVKPVVNDTPGTSDLADALRYVAGMEVIERERQSIE